MCSPPQGAGLVYLGVWAACFYTAWTATYIPYISWGTELATDYVERSRVSTFREAFTMFGSLFFVTAPLILLPTDPPLNKVLSLITLSVLLSVPLIIIPLAIAVPDLASATRTQARLLRELAEVLKDRVLLRFAVARLIWATEEGVNNSLAIFSFAVGLALASKFFWAIFILYVATLGFVPVTLRLARYVEKHKILAAGMTIQALVYATVIFMPVGNFRLIAILWALIGVANTAMLTIPSSLLADIIDHGDVISGERRSGAYVAVDNLVYKVGLALGVGISFGLLSLVHYDPSAVHYTATDARNIRLLGFGLPCLLSVPAIWLFVTHPITRGVQGRFRAQIDARQRPLQD